MGRNSWTSRRGEKLLVGPGTPELGVVRYRHRDLQGDNVDLYESWATGCNPPPQPANVRVGRRPKGDEPEVSMGEWELQGAGFPPVGNWAGAAA